MAAKPLLEESAGGNAAHLVSQLSDSSAVIEAAKKMEESLHSRDIPRKLAIYGAAAGFELRDELDHLSNRTIEPNIFFNARFLAPAMPRLEDREVRFMVMRDENETRSRLRFVMPYTVERPGLPLSVPVICSWATPSARRARRSSTMTTRSGWLKTCSTFWRAGTSSCPKYWFCRKCVPMEQPPG